MPDYSRTIQNGVLEDNEIGVEVKEFDHIAIGSNGGTDWDAEQMFHVKHLLGFMPPIKDQGPTSSCSGQAIAQYAYILNALEYSSSYNFNGNKNGELLKSILPQFSAKSIYSRISLGFHRGAYAGDAVREWVANGINTEKSVPSYGENGLPLSEESMIDRSWENSYFDKHIALNFQPSGDARLIRNIETIDTVALAIEQGFSCLLGLRVGSGTKWRDYYLSPPTTVRSGHFVVGVGLEKYKNKRGICIINSWGEDVGKKGEQWISEDWFSTGNVFSPYVVVDKPNYLWIKLLDRKGKPRYLPSSMVQAIHHLLEKRGYSIPKSL